MGRSHQVCDLDNNNFRLKQKSSDLSLKSNCGLVGNTFNKEHKGCGFKPSYRQICSGSYDCLNYGCPQSLGPYSLVAG